MEYLLFEILYRGLNFEKMRTTIHLKKHHMVKIKKHMMLLNMVLNLINAIHYKMDKNYCSLLKSKILDIVKNEPDFFKKYNSPFLKEDINFSETALDCERVIKVLNYIFLLIDSCLLEKNVDLSYLNMLFRSAHNLPRCMLIRGYLDNSYTQGISERESLTYSISNMDSDLADEISILL